MAGNDPLHELEVLLRSRYAMVHLETDDEERALTLVRHVADRLGLPFLVWTRTRGLARPGREDGIYGTEEPGKALRHVAASEEGGLFYFRDVQGVFPGDPLLQAKLREATDRLRRAPGALLFTGAALDLPPALARRAARVTLPGPDRKELEELLRRILRDVAKRQEVEVSLSRPELERLLDHLQGLTTMEVEKIMTRAIVEDGRLGPEDIRRVVEAKREVVEREGLLEYYPAEDTLEEVAGLGRLKEWLRRRKGILEDPRRAREYGLPFPRGLLLVGVPGCGKSLSAKAVAGEWSLPLLRLDPSSLYNRYIGQSEENFRRAMVAAEGMAPVVLWVDELEKAFASGDTDGGVSQRILGTFLSWMQERDGDVFVAATANQIDRLPPELLRKGRFDEIFFVDLPGEEARQEIFRIHLAQRNHDPAGFDLPALARATEGFSGAEIEQVVLSALYDAFARRTRPTTDDLVGEAGATRPLSVTAAERIGRLRDWARERAVLAE